MSDAKEPKKLDLSTMPKSISAQIDGQSMVADYREFSTGSKGYHATAKLKIGGNRCQVNLLVTVIGSKPEVKATSKKK
jgi:hypothetical protein